MARRVLVVDDEKVIVKGIRYSLEQDDYEVDCAYDGEEALEKIRANKYDVVLLDVMLPKMDGFEVCQAVREFSPVPIIMLTAKSDDMDKILGLEYGADDYITKPFNILELKARIKAVLRRQNYANISREQEERRDGIVESGDMRVDTVNRRVYIGDKEVRLTTKEFEILELMIMHPNKIYSREELLQLIWGSDYPGDGRTVDVHVRRMREKIETNPREPKYIHTKWGTGYYFQA